MKTIEAKRKIEPKVIHERITKVLKKTSRVPCEMAREGTTAAPVTPNRRKAASKRMMPSNNNESSQKRREKCLLASLKKEDRLNL